MTTSIKHFLLFFLLITNCVFGQKTDSTKVKKPKKPNFGTLFKSNDTLKFSLITHMKPLLADRGDKPVYHSGHVKYKTTKGKSVNLPIKIRVRGNFRKDRANCNFPPLLLNFDKKNKGNSVFNMQNRLKLVTHCIARDYIAKEELVYKIYNLLTDYSFKSRLATVTYIDSAGKSPRGSVKKPEIRPAFIIEDETILAKRINTKPYKKVRVRQNQLDTLTMATISIFEFMIGNTDWSVPYQHNISMFYREGALPIPVPYDFDHSGIVNAVYANPAQELNLSSVKERLYRGIFYSKPMLDRVFDKFRMAKPEIYKLYEANPALEPSYIKYATKYLDEFYEIIDNEKDVKNLIIAQGQKNEAGGVVIKGLNN
jgi:hypothetical protein